MEEQSSWLSSFHPAGPLPYYHAEHGKDGGQSPHPTSFMPQRNIVCTKIRVCKNKEGTHVKVAPTNLPTTEIGGKIPQQETPAPPPTFTWTWTRTCCTPVCVLESRRGRPHLPEGHTTAQHRPHQYHLHIRKNPQSIFFTSETRGILPQRSFTNSWVFFKCGATDLSTSSCCWL